MSELNTDDPVETPSPKGLSERLSMVRGDLGYGRKPSKTGLRAIAEYGPVSIHHYNQNDETTTIQTIHDFHAIFDDNRRQRLSGNDGYTADRSMRKVATIPDGIVDLLYKMGINIYNGNDWPKVVALLDDPEWECLRTAEGRISRRPTRTYPTEGFNKRRNRGWRGEL